MLTKIWDQWKAVRDGDPIKARLAKVLMISGIIVLPFLCVWIYAGFAKAIGMVLALGITGVGLLVLGAVINWAFGWAAHYVLTGDLKEFDDWFEATILDEIESYQRMQIKALKKQHPNVTTTNYVPPVQPKAPAPDPSARPDWLRKP